MVLLADGPASIRLVEGFNNDLQAREALKPQVTGWDTNVLFCVEVITCYCLLHDYNHLRLRFTVPNEAMHFNPEMV